MMKRGIAFLLAPGSGAPTTHPRIQEFARLLGPLGVVRPFDYPYMIEGRKRPDALPKLIAAHRDALAALRKQHSGPIVLIGKSMGGRIGCHVALVEHVAAVVCLGYPLLGGGDPAKLRDQVLLELQKPIMFVQGARDALCPLDLLDGVRKRMTAPSILHIVDGGDHSLLVSKTAIKARRTTQQQVDEDTFTAIAEFLIGLPS